MRAISPSRLSTIVSSARTVTFAAPTRRAVSTASMMTRGPVKGRTPSCTTTISQGSIASRPAADDACRVAPPLTMRRTLKKR